MAVDKNIGWSTARAWMRLVPPVRNIAPFKGRVVLVRATPGLDGTSPFRWRCPLVLSTPRPPRLVLLGDRPRGRGVDKPPAPGAPIVNIAPFKDRVVGSFDPGCDGTSPFSRHWKPPPRHTETDPVGIDGTAVDGVIHALSTVPVPSKIRGAVVKVWVTPPDDLADGIPRPRPPPARHPRSEHRPIQRPGRVGSYAPRSRRHIAVSMAMPVRPAPRAPDSEHRPIQGRVDLVRATPGLDGTSPAMEMPIGRPVPRSRTSPHSKAGWLVRTTPGAKPTPAGSGAPPLTGLSTLCPRCRSPTKQKARWSKCGQPRPTTWPTGFRARDAARPAPPIGTSPDSKAGSGWFVRPPIPTAHCRFDGDARSACPPLAHRDSFCLGDRPRGRGVDKPPNTRCPTNRTSPYSFDGSCRRVRAPGPADHRASRSPPGRHGNPQAAPPLVRVPTRTPVEWGDVPLPGGRRSPSAMPRNVRFPPKILLTYTVSRRTLSVTRSTQPTVTPAVKRRRRKDPRQTTFAFRPTGRGGARPGAGRPRVRRSRVPHRSREAIPGDRPVLVTLRVADDVPALRRARFVRAFRETLRRGAERTGFRVVHYSVQDNHAHFLMEADDRERLADGMTSEGGLGWGKRRCRPASALVALGARFARCVNRVFGRRGRVLATRFHHVVKRTPTEVRNALAYVLLNARKHYRERRGRRPPVALDAASSGRWFDGWSTSPPAGGRYADVAAGDGVAADRAGRSGGGAGVRDGAPAGPGREADEIEKSNGRLPAGPWRAMPPASASRTTPDGVVHASSTVPVPKKTVPVPKNTVPVPKKTKTRWATEWATPPDAPERGRHNTTGPSDMTAARGIPLAPLKRANAVPLVRTPLRPP